MCGRFIQTTDAEVLAAIYQVPLPFSLALRYNAAPTQRLAVIRRMACEAPREIAHLRWGLIPAWVKAEQPVTLMINARSETAAKKPSFRRPLARTRCLVPTDGWYEWLRDGEKKRPFLFRRRDRAPFVFAGIWERWLAGPEPVESFSILTTVANAVAEGVHHRMPVVVGPGNQDLWLDPDMTDVDRLEPLLGPSTAEVWEVTEVVPRVNNVRNQGPGLLEPARAPA